MRYWDQAATPSSGCYTAGLLLALDQWGVYYVENVIRGQCGPLERNRVIDQVTDADSRRHRGTVLTFVEKEGGSGGKEIAAQMINRLSGHAVFRDVVSGKRHRLSSGERLPGKAKVIRALGLAKDAFRRVFLRRELARTRQIVPPPVLNDDGRCLLGPPRAIETAATAQEKRDIKEVHEAYTEVQLLGRDQGHDTGGIDVVMAKMRQVNSSNVWGYYFEVEGGYNQSVGKYRGAKSGLLYVTFLAESPKGGPRPSSAGPTYVYFDVPAAKFEQFQAASESSAGRAVWDYLRVRGTSWQHQHRYRLAQVQGDYIPRKGDSTGVQRAAITESSSQQNPEFNLVCAVAARALGICRYPEVREQNAAVAFARTRLEAFDVAGQVVLAESHNIEQRKTESREAESR